MNCEPRINSDYVTNYDGSEFYSPLPGCPYCGGFLDFDANERVIYCTSCRFHGAEDYFEENFHG